MGDQDFDASPQILPTVWTEVFSGGTTSFIGIPGGTDDVSRMNTRITITGLMVQLQLRRIGLTTSDNHCRLLLIQERTRDGNHLSTSATTGDLPRYNLGHGDTGTSELILAPHTIFSGKKYKVLYDRIHKWPDLVDPENQKTTFISKKFKVSTQLLYSGTGINDEQQNRISLYIAVDRATAAAQTIRLHWQAYYVDTLA